MPDPISITEEIQALMRLDLDGLRQQWTLRCGEPASKVRSPELLLYCLAWRIQAAALGGLDGPTRRRLRSGGAGEGRTDHLSPGVCISREWRGQTYQVDRVEDGYRWDGAIYLSLSAVAQAITGVKRNGPKFFGLRTEEVA